MITINVADLSTMDTFVVGMMLSPVIPSRRVHELEKRRVDGYAVELECDEERAEAIVDVLRIKNPGLRAYRNGKKM